MFKKKEEIIKFTFLNQNPIKLEIVIKNKQNQNYLKIKKNTPK